MSIEEKHIGTTGMRRIFTIRNVWGITSQPWIKSLWCCTWRNRRNHRPFFGKNDGIFHRGSEADLAIANQAVLDKAAWEKADADLKSELSGTISGVEGRVKAIEDANYSQQITDAVNGAKSELNGTINGVSERVKALEDADFGTKISEAEGRLNTAISAAEGRVQGNIDLVNAEIDAMNLTEVKNAAGFISAVSQSEGKVSASATAFDAAVTAESNIAPTSAAVVTYVGGQIEAYDATLIAVTNEEIDTIFA